MKFKTLSMSNVWLTVMCSALVLFPFVYDSRSFLILLTQIFIFAVFAMSYDLLLGYTGIVSFGHAMFFGIGAYTVAIGMARLDDSIAMLLLSFVIAIILSGLVSYVVGVLSLRLKSHFYAMLTLAFSGLFLVGAEKWRSVTMGNDGFTFAIPEVLKDREVFYFTALAFMIIMYLFMRRFTQSPLGRVLQAIRENEQRTESLGYRILHYKVIASIVSGVVASLAGGMYVLTLRFVNTSVFAIDKTMDALLMTIIGGVGTLFGGIMGAALLKLAHYGLADLAKVHWIFERWMIFFGIVFVLVILFFPQGIVGTLKQWWIDRQLKKSMKDGSDRTTISS
jgi:branched-chain amino acid transport system permease protein